MDGWQGKAALSQGEAEHAYGGDTLKQAAHKEGSKSGTEKLQAAFQAKRIRLVQSSM